MKRLQVFSWIVFLALLQCSGGDNGSDPAENSNSLLVSSDIGPAGGSIDAGDISFEVPASAFSTTTTLAVYRSDQATDEGIDRCSDLFFLQGLPKSFDGTIKVRIALTKPLVETGYIAVSQAPFVQEAGNHKAAPILIEASESSGYLIGEWSAPAGVSAMSYVNAKASSDEVLKRYFQAWMNRKPKNTVSHFEYHWPASLDANIKSQVQADLEQALDSIVDRGLDISKMRWPMPVYSWRFISGLEDRYCAFLRPESQVFVLAFDATKLLDPVTYAPEIRAAGMRELLHAVLASGDPGYFQQNSQADPKHYWFHHAFASYAEEWLGYAEDEHPLDFDNGNQSIQAPLKGMVAGQGTTLVQSMMHGGGMSAMAKYIVDNYQESILLSLSSEIAAGSHPVKALIDAVAPYNTLNVWYMDFMKEYTRGAIYDYTINDVYDSESWSIDGTNDTTHTFDLTVPDLGARVCEIFLTEGAIDEVTFTLSSSQVAADDMEVIVHGNINSQNDTYLTSAGLQARITNVKALRSQGVTKLSAVVVNAGEHPPTYNQSGAMSLKVDVGMKETPAYNHGRIAFDVLENYTRIELDPLNTQSYVRRFGPGWDYAPGAFTSPTTWSADWNTIDFYNRPYSGTMMVEFDESHQQVLTFEARATFQPEVGIVQTISILGHNLSLISSDSDIALYETRGEATCNSIIELTNYRDFGDATETLDSIICQSSDYVLVYLKKMD